MTFFFDIKNFELFKIFKKYIKINFLFFFLFLLIIILLLYFFLKKNKKKYNQIYFNKIKEKNIWLSDLIKLLFLGNQKGKNIFFIISKKISFNHFDEEISLSSEFNFILLKSIINGFDDSNIGIGVNIFSQICFLKFKNFNPLEKNEIIVSMTTEKKNFLIKYFNKEILLSSPASTINIIKNFLEN